MSRMAPVVIAKQPVDYLRAVLPAIESVFSDMHVRFLANKWSPIRVVDETNDPTPRIWLRALNFDVVYQNGYIIRSHPKKYSSGGVPKEFRITHEELMEKLEELIGPYRL